VCIPEKKYTKVYTTYIYIFVGIYIYKSNSINVLQRLNFKLRCVNTFGKNITRAIRAVRARGLLFALFIIKYK